MLVLGGQKEEGFNVSHFLGGVLFQSSDTPLPVMQKEASCHCPAFDRSSSKGSTVGT